MKPASAPRVARKRGDPLYMYEDQPAYKHAVIVPYFHNTRTNQVHIYTSMTIDDANDSYFKPMRATIK